MKEKLKVLAKGGMSLIAIALGTMIVTKIVGDLYDLRLVIAAAGGAFGFKPLCDLFSKIKGLE